MDCRCPVVEFTAAEAGRVAGIPARTIQSWNRSGLLEPSVPLPPIGPDYVYGFTDLMTMRFAQALRKASTPTWLVERALKEFRGPELDFRSLVTKNLELWAVTPTEAELGEMTLDEFDEVLRFMKAEDVASLPDNDPSMYLAFPCHEAANQIDASLDAWFTARTAPRPEWC